MNPKVIIALRVLLGLPFLVFGLDGFLRFMEQPGHNEAGAAFWGALEATEYFMPLLKGVEIVIGALLISGKFVPLALVMLAPITINIVAYHLTLDERGLPIAIVIVGLHLLLARVYRRNFAGLFKSRLGGG